jgi:hypothetical protein
LKGYLPAFTDNAYVLAFLTESFNRQLIQLAFRRNIKVVDLNGWLESQKSQRSELFFDSVHLYPSGQILLGKFIANSLLSCSPLLSTVATDGDIQMIISMRSNGAKESKSDFSACSHIACET